MKRSSRYRSAAGMELYRVEYPALGEMRGAVILVHGLGDHIDRYDEVGALFARRGMHVIGVDLPGHGQSPGVRGHLGRWGTIEPILEELVGQAKEATGGELPLGLMAHSMGGFISLRFLQQISGTFRFAWISSPLVKPGEHRGPVMRAVAPLAARVIPWWTVDTEVRAEMCRPIRSDKDRDPLIHRRISLSWGAEILRLEREIASALDRIDPSLRLLVTHGSEDRVCPPHYSRELFDALPVEEKQYETIAGALHEPFFDVDHREEVLALAGRWMDGIGYPVVVDS